jgi:hypothetical protein
MSLQERIGDAHERHSEAAEERLCLEEDCRATIARLRHKRQENREQLERLREIRHELQREIQQRENW